MDCGLRPNFQSPSRRRCTSRETVGIKDECKAFHSFRHTFKNAWGEAAVSEEMHDALTEHADGGVGRSYGARHFPLTPLAEAVAKVKYRA